uniref:(northern house mosquito) hypothetical protein n=1 Tax=Culex pipiens TaxID=7175 RepID=A0A8D8JDD5_CULPI
MQTETHQPGLGDAARVPAGVLQTARKVRGHVRILQHGSLPPRPYGNHATLHGGHQGVLRDDRTQAEPGVGRRTAPAHGQLFCGARSTHEGCRHGSGLRSTPVRPPSHGPLQRHRTALHL